ncbi:hypothetical protein SARC_09505 [Sphaeroforma arctica JP610]|uniref:Uncharacterized protein n=1 Tax=Sphaeroforma arctica JP610 TaxID=667725 RepID=A0A0L0FMR2_9EUKA|nr:hypothetical protein SARC_09505 [Sphaeroforma arctica JP610]KNC78049.1 hypothetical protein SARC_09505 [Sphaeroforma arctica JP610]|eukprot:XP_014151951.1 hypothetical protein SARC_09505 [Sphaeroforma arctica JP610]
MTATETAALEMQSGLAHTSVNTPVSDDDGYNSFSDDDETESSGLLPVDGEGETTDGDTYTHADMQNTDIDTQDVHRDAYDDDDDDVEEPGFTVKKDNWFTRKRTVALLPWLLFVMMLTCLFLLLSVIVGCWLGAIYARHAAAQFDTFSASNMQVTGLGYPGVQVETDVAVWGIPSFVSLEIEPAQVYLYLPTPTSAHTGADAVEGDTEGLCIQPPVVDAESQLALAPSPISPDTRIDTHARETTDTHTVTGLGTGDDMVFASLYIPRIQINGGSGRVHAVSPLTLRNTTLLTPQFAQEMVDGQRAVCFATRVSVGVKLLFGKVNLLFDVDLNKRVSVRDKTSPFAHVMPYSVYEMLPWLHAPLHKLGLDAPLKWILDPEVSHNSSGDVQSALSHTAQTHATHLSVSEQTVVSGQDGRGHATYAQTYTSPGTPTKLQATVHEGMRMLSQYNSTVQHGVEWWHRNGEASAELSRDVLSVLLKNEGRAEDVMQLGSGVLLAMERTVGPNTPDSDFNKTIMQPAERALKQLDSDWAELVLAANSTIEWTVDNAQWLAENGTAVIAWTYKERDLTGRIVKGLALWAKLNAAWLGKLLSTTFDRIVKPNWDLLAQSMVVVGDFVHAQAPSMVCLPTWGMQMVALVKNFEEAGPVPWLQNAMQQVLDGVRRVTADVHGLVDERARYLLTHGLTLADFLYGSAGSLANLLNTIYDVGDAILRVNVKEECVNAEFEFQGFFTDPQEVVGGKLNHTLSVWLSDLINRFLTLWMNFRKVVKTEIMSSVELRAAETVISGCKAAGIDLEQIIKDEVGSIAAYIFSNLSPQSLIKVLVWGKSNSMFEGYLVAIIQKVVSHWDLGSLMSKLYQYARVVVAYNNAVVGAIWKHIDHPEIAANTYLADENLRNG